MFVVQFFIPLADPDGDLFLQIDFIAFEREIVARFVSFSVLVDDEEICYSIDVPSISYGAKVYELALFAKALFVQDSIIICYLGQYEELS